MSFLIYPKITSLALELLKKEELIQQNHAEGYHAFWND